MKESEYKEINEKKRYLRRYQKSVKKLERLEHKIIILNDRINATHSPTFSDMPKGHNPVKTEDLIFEKLELEKRAELQRAQVHLLRAEITHAIDQLEDVKHVEVLEWIFIDGCTPESIARNNYCDVRTVYRRYREALVLLSLNCQ